ncbi:MAG TPA: class I adenylate-forming enzyme family protein, partial [Acidobacteriaceae bacterium]
MREHLATLVEDFRRHAQQTALVLHRGNRSYPTTYGQLADLSGRFAAELDRRGIAPGDRVLIWGHNSPEWIAAFFGCLLRGVLAVPLDAAGSPHFAARVLADVAPRLIVGDTALLRTLPTAVPLLAFATLASHLPAQPDFYPSPSVRPDTPFQIIFTSGTTSEPKGIVHTHRNVLASLTPIENEIARYRKYERWVHPLRFLHTLPLSHVFGQFMGLWVPALLAAQLHFTDAPEPSRMLALLRGERISALVAVPRTLSLLEQHLLRRFPSLAARIAPAAALPAWRRWWRFRDVHRATGFRFWALLCGGASLPQPSERFWNTLGFPLIQGYGMTETAALVTLNHPFRIAHGTLGKPLPGRQVRLSGTGEILVRGDMVSTLTWRHGRLQPQPQEWLATGDLAQTTPSGDLRFLGRSGDAIITSAGLNLYPADLENALALQPGVRASVVVSCPGPQGPEAVAVLLFSGNDHALQQAVAQANLTLAPFQQVRRFLRWPKLDFPSTSTGKLLRREVAAWACSTLQSPSTPSGDPLLALIAE